MKMIKKIKKIENKQSQGPRKYFVKKQLNY